MAPALNSIPAGSRDRWGRKWEFTFAVRHLHRTVMQDYIEIDAHLLYEHSLPISHRVGCSVMLLQSIDHAIRYNHHAIWYNCHFRFRSICPQNWIEDHRLDECASWKHSVSHNLPNAYSVLAKILAQSVSTRSTFATVALRPGIVSWYSCILISESSFIFADEMNHFRWPGIRGTQVKSSGNENRTSPSRSSDGAYINCLFTNWKCTYILDFRPKRWSALNMGFVIKRPSRMQGHCFFEVGQGGQQFSVGFRKFL